MAEVDLEKLLKAEEEKKASASDIQTKRIGDATFFKGKLLNKWFSDYGECVSENQKEALKQRNAKLGLDEFGRTPEDVERSKVISALVKDRLKLMEELKKLDLKIANAKVAKAEKKPEQKKGK